MAEKYTQEVAEKMIAEYDALHTETAPALARMAEIKKFFTGMPHATYKTEHGSVIVARNSSFDEERFREKYPAAEYPQLYAVEGELNIEAILQAFPREAHPGFYTERVVVNREAVSDELSPAQLREVTTEGTPRITIKPAGK